MFNDRHSLIEVSFAGLNLQDRNDTNLNVTNQVSDPYIHTSVTDSLSLVVIIGYKYVMV